jgi:hypothetical protein
MLKLIIRAVKETSGMDIECEYVRHNSSLVLKALVACAQSA